MADTEQQSRKPRARDINEMIRYTTFSVFRVRRVALSNPEKALIEAEDALSTHPGVVTRGWYDVGALRGDADVMLWQHAESSDELQDTYHALLRTEFGAALEPVWSQMGLHRPAEFNRGHVPAFMAEEDPGQYLCVYPFVRSYEWYLLPEEERREMLVEHGMMGREYPDVRANTVSNFALGDYEWLLAFEATELYRIVDLMRHLRASKARMHVREEIPFYTGRRLPLPEIMSRILPQP